MFLKNIKIKKPPEGLEELGQPALPFPPAATSRPRSEPAERQRRLGAAGARERGRGVAWAREACHGQGRRWRAGQAGLSRGQEQGAAVGSGRGGVRKGEGREREGERKRKEEKKNGKRKRKGGKRERKGEIHGGDNDAGRARAAVAAACRGWA